MKRVVFIGPGPAGLYGAILLLEQGWPDPYLSDKAQLERNLERAAQAVGPV